MKRCKATIILLIAIVLIALLASSVLAAPSPGDVLIKDNIEGGEELKTFGNKVLGVTQIVGMIASVIILSVLGFKIMMGSTEEKAKYKSKLMPYVIGAIILFAAPTLANALYNAFKL